MRITLLKILHTGTVGRSRLTPSRLLIHDTKWRDLKTRDPLFHPRVHTNPVVSAVSAKVVGENVSKLCANEFQNNCTEADLRLPETLSSHVTYIVFRNENLNRKAY